MQAAKMGENARGFKNLPLLGGVPLVRGKKKGEMRKKERGRTDDQIKNTDDEDTFQMHSSLGRLSTWERGWVIYRINGENGEV